MMKTVLIRDFDLQIRVDFSSRNIKLKLIGMSRNKIEMSSTGN